MLCEIAEEEFFKVLVTYIKEIVGTGFHKIGAKWNGKISETRYHNVQATCNVKKSKNRISQDESNTHLTKWRLVCALSEKHDFTRSYHFIFYVAIDIIT